MHTHLTLSPARSTTRKAAAAAHARSASQPCHPPHPALARLDGDLRALRAWSASGCCGQAAAADRSNSGSVAALALVEAALAALGALLNTPRAAAALHGAGDQTLDGFLALADAYGTFGSALLAARQSVAEARAGVRRRDGAAVAASVRAHRRAERDLCHLAGTLRHVSRHVAAAMSRPEDAATDNELVGVVAETAVATAEASGVLFLGCAAMPPDVSAMLHTVASHNKWLARLGVVPATKAKVPPETAAVALEKLEELEERIGALESGSEKVFRRLLQTRVLLLNIHNPL